MLNIADGAPGQAHGEPEQKRSEGSTLDPDRIWVQCGTPVRYPYLDNEVNNDRREKRPHLQLKCGVVVVPGRPGDEKQDA